MANERSEWSFGKSDIEGKAAMGVASSWEANEFQMAGSE